MINSPVSYWQAKDELGRIATDPDIIFRGQEDVAWDLQPSLLREGKLQQIRDPLERKRFVEALLMQFHQICTEFGFPTEECNPGSNIPLLCIAQHYGLPTSLLDWSRSPYIALWFAFGGWGYTRIPQGRDVVVWCLNWRLFRQGAIQLQRDESMTENADDDHVWRAYQHRMDRVLRIDRVEGLNKRRVAQKGVFTDLGIMITDLKEYIGQRVFPPETLTQVVIRGRDQATALADLAASNIDATYMRRDADGAALDVWTKYLR